MIGSMRNTVVVALAGFLAAVPLTQVTGDNRFLPGVLLLAALLQGLAAVARRYTEREWPVSVAQLAVLLAALLVGAHLANPGQPASPPWKAVGETFAGAFTHVGDQTAPMAPDDSTLVVLVGGMGLLTVAIDVAFIAWRSVLAATVPLLLGYGVATVVVDESVAMTSLLAVGVGWLLLLASRTLDHERRWPRGLLYETNPRLQMRGFSMLTLGLGVSGLAGALVAGLAIPSTPSDPWADNGTGGTLQLTDPSIDLNENLRRPEDRPLLSYTTTAPDGVMLRSSALTRVDGAGWHQVDMMLQRGYPTRVPGLAGVQPTDSTEVVVGEFASLYLPVPYAPVGWQAEGLWDFDPASLTVLNVDPGTGPQHLQDLRYTVASRSVEPSAQQVADAAAGTPPEGVLALEVPADVPAQITDLARQITADAPTDGRKAIALQDWLRDPERFRYNLAAPSGTGYEVLVSFLTDERSGYCVHFAASMALMSRVVGIPSRVAVGFTSGTQQADGSWLVSSHDMHAWPELYFSGLGWVRFEPTVSVGEEPSWTNLPDPAATPTPGSQASASVEPSGPPTNPPADSGSDEPPGTSQGLGAPDAGRLAGALALLLALAGPGLARAWLRRRRLTAGDAPGRVSGAWRELRATAIDLSLGWPDATPRQVAGAPWPDLDPAGHAALTRLAMLTERLRYSPGLPAEVAVADDVALVTRQLRAGLPLLARLWTRVAPLSLLREWGWRRAGVHDTLG